MKPAAGTTPIEGPRLAFVALGSNLGDSRCILRTAIERLQAFSVAPLRVSSLWHTEPVDCPPGSRPFLNAVAALTPAADETPERLLRSLQELESTFGRPPKQVRNEPRPLDLDLLAFGLEVRDTPALVLPHPRAPQRAFVLAPLHELAPDLVLPGQTRSVTHLLAECPDRHTVRRLD